MVNQQLPSLIISILSPIVLLISSVFMLLPIELNPDEDIICPFIYSLDAFVLIVYVFSVLAINVYCNPAFDTPGSINVVTPVDDPNKMFPDIDASTFEVLD